jgi:RNA polymerase sigma-70 factor (ECF subfamily)
LFKEKDDRQLTARLKGRDTRALREVIRRYSGYVSAVIRHTLRERLRLEDCEELCADVFVSLWHSVPELKPGASLKPWLAVVARNKAHNWTRGRRVQELPLDEADESSGASQLRALEQEMSASRWDGDWDATDELTSALATLDEKSRDILTRHYYLQQTVREIAGDTGSSEASVKTRLYRGRRSLRESLQARQVGWQTRENKD